jgi:hypothetical protein
VKAIVLSAWNTMLLSKAFLDHSNANRSESAVIEHVIKPNLPCLITLGASIIGKDDIVI